MFIESKKDNPLFNVKLNSSVTIFVLWSDNTANTSAENHKQIKQNYLGLFTPSGAEGP